jgi:mRNA interferase MazF
MVSPTVGKVVLVPFPFSDLSKSKLRPAVVLADAGRGDWILCQVTSNLYGDASAVRLTDECFIQGSLRIASFARPGKLFTASFGLMPGEVAALMTRAASQIIEAVITILQSSVEEGDAKHETTG